MRGGDPLGFRWQRARNSPNATDRDGHREMNRCDWRNSCRRMPDRVRRRSDLEASWYFKIGPDRTTDVRRRTTDENPSSVLRHLFSGWASIMRAIKCLKGIWWMPWR